MSAASVIHDCNHPRTQNLNGKRCLCKQLTWVQWLQSYPCVRLTSGILVPNAPKCTSPFCCISTILSHHSSLFHILSCAPFFSFPILRMRQRPALKAKEQWAPPPVHQVGGQDPLGGGCDFMSVLLLKSGCRHLGI